MAINSKKNLGIFLIVLMTLFALSFVSATYYRNCEGNNCCKSACIRWGAYGQSSQQTRTCGTTTYQSGTDLIKRICIQTAFATPNGWADYSNCICNQKTTNYYVIDNDKDGYNSTVDCDDNNANVHPGATEICNGIDDNCINGIDENNVCGNQSNQTTYFYCDVDGDSYFSITPTITCLPGTSCVPFGCLTTPGNDCNDNNPLTHPNAVELCDLVDNNCNGIVDENCQNPPINDTTAPASVSNLELDTRTTNYLQWSWKNPSDNDFAFSLIFINGNNIANTSNQYYRATGLNKNTQYTITIHTADFSGNINNTNVENTATTKNTDNGDDDDDDDDDNDDKDNQDMIDSYIDLGLANYLLGKSSKIQLSTISINPLNNTEEEQSNFFPILILILSIILIILLIALVFYWFNR